MALGNVARLVAGRAEARLLARSGLVAVLTLAAALRLGAPWLYHFQDDQALFLTIARPFLEGGSLPQHSVVFSVGVLTPPLVEYLLMIPLALSPSPEVATAFMAALDVAAVGLCYWCGRRFLGAWGGLSAALLYAVNPSVLLQVRKIQSHNFAPVFAALTLWGLYQLACTRRPAYLVAILAGYSALLQMHLAYLFYAPLVIGVLAVCWRAWRLIPVLIGSLLATLPWLPFVYFEVTHDFVNLHRALQFSSRPASWDADALRLVVTLVGGSGYLSQLNLGTSLTGATTPLDTAGLLEVALFLLGGALLSGDLARAVLSRVRARRACLASVPSAPSTSGARCQRAADHRSAALWFPLLTLAWAFIPVLATLKHSILLLSHYYVAAFPALFLVVGAALQRCGTQCWAAAGLGGAAPWRASLPTWRMWMVGAATLCVALWQGVEFPLFVNAAAERGPWLYYGMAMGYSLQAAQLAQRVAGDGPIYLAAHHPLELPFNYLLWQRRPVKRFDVAHDLVLPGPNGPAVTYVVQEDRSDALAFLDRLLAGARRGRVLTPGGRPVYSIYRLTPEAAEEALRALKLRPVEATIGGVVALRGAQLDARIEPPGPARAVLYWEVAGDPARLPAEVTQFAHLVDNQWRGWGGEDFQGYPRSAWARGDRVLTWFAPELARGAPDGLYWLATGMYSRFDLHRFPVADPQGHNLGGALRLGPLKAAPRPDDAPAAPPLARFGDLAVLTQADVAPQQAAPGATLQVRLMWQALAAPGRDYTVFVHLLDGDGKLVAQGDGPPAGGEFPTRIWEAGDQVRDEHMVRLPADARPGPYHVAVGLYTVEGLRRLPVAGPSGAVLGDAFTLSEVCVGC